MSAKAKTQVKQHLKKHRTQPPQEKEEVTENEEQWIQYIIEHIDQFTGIVSRYWENEKIYSELAQHWDKDIQELRDRTKAMGVDMARDNLLSSLTHWVASDFTPEEAGPYIEAGANTSKGVRKLLDLNVSPEEATMKMTRQDLIEVGVESEEADRMIEESKDLAPPKTGMSEEEYNEMVTPTLAYIVSNERMDVEEDKLQIWLKQQREDRVKTEKKRRKPDA